MIKRIAVILFSMTSLAGSGEGYSDETIKQTFIDYLRPRTVDKDFDSPGRKELIDVVQLRSDTNRLARLLVELARTNDAWYVDMAMWQLEKYATSEQLPFLYSCATNPAIGHKAMKAVLNVEGITSNSLAVIGTYLTGTNVFSRSRQHDRALFCENLLKTVFVSSEIHQYQTHCLLMAVEFAKNRNTMHISLDETICNLDPTYRNSKRRLQVMRMAENRCINQGLYNYVTNAISELVAYPEADLPE